MAKTLLQYSSLYILFLFIGSSFCTLGKDYPIVIVYEGTTYVAMGRITFGQWTKNSSGDLVVTGSAKSVITLSEAGQFEVPTEKIELLGDNGEFNGYSFISNNKNIVRIRLALPMNPPSDGKLSYELLKNEVGFRNEMKFISFDFIRTYKDDNQKIVYELSAGSEGKSYPDVKLVSADGLKKGVEVFGYWNKPKNVSGYTSTMSDVRLLGNYAFEFEGAIPSGSTFSSWIMTELDIIDTNSGSQVLSEKVLGKFKTQNSSFAKEFYFACSAFDK